MSFILVDYFLILKMNFYLVVVFRKKFLIGGDYVFIVGYVINFLVLNYGYFYFRVFDVG